MYEEISEKEFWEVYNGQLGVKSFMDRFRRTYSHGEENELEVRHKIKESLAMHHLTRFAGQSIVRSIVPFNK